MSIDHRILASLSALLGWTRLYPSLLAVTLLAGCGIDEPPPSHVEQQAVEIRPTAVEQMATGLSRAVTTHESMLFGQWTHEEVTVDALSRIGAPAVPALVQLLGDREPDLRHDAAIALARLGPKARAAVPTLIECLNDEDADVRKSAARALGQIGPEAEAAIAPLIKSLRQAVAEKKAESPKNAH